MYIVVAMITLCVLEIMLATDRILKAVERMERCEEQMLDYLKTIASANAVREGIVVWFVDSSGNYRCLKHKSE